MALIGSICVFCGSAAGDDPVYSEEGRKLGQLMAQKDITLVYGGGHVGIMGAVAEGALEENGHVIGIIPGHLDEKEETFLEIPELEIVPHMYTRKNRMKDISESFCMLPGGIGSLDEIFEVITLRQLNRHNKPIIIVNTNGFWTPWVKLVDNIIGHGFARREHSNLYKVVDTVDEVIPAIEAELEEIAARGK